MNKHQQHNELLSSDAINTIGERQYRMQVGKFNMQQAIWHLHPDLFKVPAPFDAMTQRAEQHISPDALKTPEAHPVVAQAEHTPEVSQARARGVVSNFTEMSGRERDAAAARLATAQAFSEQAPVIQPLSEEITGPDSHEYGVPSSAVS